MTNEELKTKILESHDRIGKLIFHLTWNLELSDNDFEDLMQASSEAQILSARLASFVNNATCEKAYK